MALAAACLLATPAMAQTPRDCDASSQRAGVDAALRFTVQVEVVRPGASDPFAGGSFAPGRVAGANGGSGMVFRPDGLIATNAHVVAGASAITVRLRDGKSWPAEIVGVDPVLDLAVLRMRGPAPSTLATFADSGAISEGDGVWAVGAPLGYGFSVTGGVMSGRARAYDDAYAVPLLQHDAALNPGNSGGPLVDCRGRVVGINTAIPPETLFDIGVGLAIPAEIARPALDRLARDGQIVRGRLGLSVVSADADVATALGAPATGLLIDALSDSGPARQAGLVAGDLILRLDDTVLAAPRDLTRALLDSAPGQTSQIAYFRGGQVMIARVRLEADAPLRQAQTSPSPWAPLDPGVSLATSDWDGGVAVTAVRPGGGGGLYGLRAGDRLRAVNGVVPRSAADAMALLDPRHAEAALLRIERAGEPPRHVVLPLTLAAAARRPPGRRSDAAAGPF